MAKSIGERFEEGLAAARERYAAVRAEREREEREAAEREQAERAERRRREHPEPLVDSTITSVAQQHARVLLDSITRWQAAVETADALSRSVDHWTAGECQSDSDVERAVITRKVLKGEMPLRSPAEKGEIQKKVDVISAAIDAAVLLGLFSISEPLVLTSGIEALIGGRQTRRFPNGEYFTVSVDELRRSEVGLRILRVLECYGVSPIDEGFAGSCVAIPCGQRFRTRLVTTFKPAPGPNGPITKREEVWLFDAMEIRAATSAVGESLKAEAARIEAEQRRQRDEAEQAQRATDEQERQRIQKLLGMPTTDDAAVSL